MAILNQDTPQNETSEQYRLRIVGNIKNGSIPSHIAKDPKFFEEFKVKMDSLKQAELQGAQHLVEPVDQVESPVLSGVTSQAEFVQPQQRREKLPEEKSMLELIADKALNIGAGAVERAGELGGSLLTTAQTIAEDLDKAIPLGGPAFKEGDIFPTWVSSEEFYKEREEKGLKSPLSFVGEKLKDVKLGYEEAKNWEDVKQSFSEGGAFSGSAYADVLEYAVEQGIKSIPDMVAVIGAMPSYLVARSGEIGEIRAKNKGKEKADSADILEAAPFAVASALLEKIGVKGMASGATEILGKEMLKAGMKESAKRIGKEAGKATLKEAGTEAVQEGILEYVGERFGTDAEMSFKEALDRGAGAAVAGGIFGGGISGVSTAVSEQVQKKKVSKLQYDEEGNVIGGTLPVDDDVSETGIGITVEEAKKGKKPDLPYEMLGDVIGDAKKEDAEQKERRKKIDEDYLSYDKELNKRLDTIDKLEEERNTLSAKKTKSKKDVKRQQQINKRIETESKSLHEFISKKGETREAIKPVEVEDVKKVKEKSIEKEVIEKPIEEVKETEEPATVAEKKHAEIKRRTALEKGEGEIDTAEDLIKDQYGNMHGNLKMMRQTIREAKGKPKFKDVLVKTKKRYQEAKKEYIERINLIEIDPEYKQLLNDYDLPELKKNLENDKFDYAKVEAIKTVEQEQKEAIDFLQESEVFEDKPTDYKNIIDHIIHQVRFTNEQGAKLTPKEIKSGVQAIKSGKTTKRSQDIIRTLENAKKEGLDLYQLPDQTGGQRGSFSETKRITASEYREMLSGVELRQKKEEGKPNEPDVFFGKQSKEDPKKLASKQPIEKVAPKKKPSDKVFESGVDSPMGNYQKMYKSLGLPERPGTNQVDVGGKKITLKPEDNPTRREGIQAQVENIIGTRLYNSKIKQKSALGIYNQQNSEVRTQDYFDVEILAHEMAHFLDFHYTMKNKFKNAYKKDVESLKEVEGLSYTSDPDLIAIEGFAEYVRLWLTQYNVAKEKAPKFTERFEAVLKTDKALNRKMKSLQADMHRWFYQGDMARLNAVTSGNQYTPKERVTKILNQRPAALLRQKYIDHIHAAKVITTDVKGHLGDATTDPYKQLQLINGVEGIFEQSVQNGAPKFTEDGNIEFVGASLDDVWKESVKHSVKRLREQEQYFIARRAQELKKQDRENLLTEGMIQEGLKLGKKYPYFQKSFKDYQEYRKNMMEFYVETGYLERKAAIKMMERNKNYVPFHRVTEGIIESGKGGGASFQKLKGGTQNIKHVYDNILMQDSKHLQQALKAKALRDMYSEGLKSQEGSKFFSKIEAGSKPIKLMLDQMLEKTGRMIEELGIDINSELNDDMYDYFESHPEELIFWSFGQKPKTSETMIDSFIDEETGKRVWVELNKENKLLPDMLDALDGFSLPKGIAGKALSAAMKVKQFQTLTITSMMQFAGPNIVRDQQQAFFLSGGAYRPFIDPIKGFTEYLKSAVGKESLFDEMRGQGGPGGGRVRTFLENEWGFADKKDYKVDKPFYHPSQLAKDLLDVYVGIMDSAEMATRIGFYARMRSKGKSAREAAFMAREISTDFAKHGSYAPFVLLQRTVPFFGAYVQSVDRDLRGMFERNGKIRFSNLLKNPEGKEEYSSMKMRMFAIGQLYISIHIALALMGDDEEAYKALTPDQKARFFHYFTGGEHHTIPKPHGLVTLFGSLAEGLTDIVQGQEKESVKKDLLFAIAYHLGMDAMPGIINPVAELALNETFTGAPIVGRHAEARSPELQYSDRTPQIYVILGKKLGVSPDKARHVVKGYTGYLEEIIAENTEEYMWDTEAWGERPNKRTYKDMVSKQFSPKKTPFRTKYTVGYYELKKRALKVKADYSFAVSQLPKGKELFEEILTKNEKMELLSLNKMFTKIDESLKNTRDQVSLITYNKDLTGNEKTEKIERLFSEKNKLLKDVYFNASKVITKTEKTIKDKKTES